MEIVYKNSLGQVTFYGGSSSGIFRITQITGLGITDKKFTVISYPGRAGQKTTQTTDGARVITLAGDIYLDGSEAFHTALRVLYSPGEIVINGTRKIGCYCNVFQPGDRNGLYRTFTMQLTCDSPYFTDPVNTVVGLFGVENHLVSPFTFPLVVSSRTTGATIIVAGDIKVEPVLHITDLAHASSHVGQLQITNVTTGQHITLNYSPTGNEIVTIDIPNRKIYNGSGTNLLGYISDDTFLNDFWLAVGQNIIECGSTITTINVACEYSNNYIEAVTL